MLSRERFLIALKGGIADRVPIFEFPFSQRIQRILLGYSTELYEGKEAVKIANKLGIDAVPVFLGGYCGVEFFKTDGMDCVDDWGVRYKRKGYPIISQIESPIKGRKDWQQYSMPDPKASWRFKQLADAADANQKDKAIIACIRGPVSVLSWFLLNIESLSYNIADDPSLVMGICDSFVEWSLRLAETAAGTEKIDAFLIADDWGMTNSLLISPKILRKFFLKPFKRLVQGIRRLGYPVIMHNDGNIWEMLEELVKTGIDAYHPVEKAASMDLGRIKQKYKGRLCPIGNIDNKKILVTGTPEDVKKETLRCLEEGSKDGGYIISSDHSLHDDIPIENVWAYINTAKKYGMYKKDKLIL